MDIAVMERALERERKRRAAAEALLEEKSRELYLSYKDLEDAHNELQVNKDQLVQSEKMASLGIMSAGVAHEINNPIGFVRSNLNTLGEYAPVFSQVIEQTRKLMDESGASPTVLALKELFEAEDIDFVLEDANDIIDESKSGIARVCEIVGGLKTFSHLDTDEHSQVDVNATIENTLTIVRGQLKHKCAIHAELADLPPILGSSGRLGQVFMNLIVNASQALSEADGVIQVRSTTSENHVFVTVQDNGCGISEEHQKRLFEPFFTTKDVGEGTGLGLSISLGVIEEHRGELTCESELGMGTTFTVKLPKIESD